MPNNTQKLLIAGASVPVAEAAFALAHTGSLGVICGLAAGAVAYWLADEFHVGEGEELSSPDLDAVASPVTGSDPTPTKEPGRSSFLYRVLNGKSVRPTDGTGNELQAKPERQKKADQPRSSRTTDPYILQLSPEYNPHINDVLGRCILGIGQRGTGKSNLAARLFEQVGRHPVPMFIGDYKGDYVTLPEVLARCVVAGAPTWEGRRECRTYWQITKQNAYKVGAFIMQRGVQLVFECLSYETLDEAAEIMTAIIKGMYDWALKQDADQRIPALVALDEAQQFLPQNQGDSRVDQEISNQLFLAFEKLNSIGRSLGFTPAFFTQRIAQIRKEVIGGSEIFFLMRQTLPQDLRGYEDLIGKDEKGKLRLDRRIVQKLEQGYGIVFEDGEFFVTHFDERSSDHPSVTPELEDAIAFYEGRNTSLQLDVMEPLPSNPRQQGTKASEQPRGTAVQQEQRQGQPGARSHLALVREETAVSASHPGQRTIATPRRIPGIPAGLQEAAQIYRPGMSHHDLGRALHCSSTEARILWQELRKYQRVLEHQASTYQLAVANGGQVASYTDQTTPTTENDVPDEEEPGLIQLGKGAYITQEQFAIAIRLRQTGKSTGYRDLGPLFDLSEHHAKALNKLINDTLGNAREGVSE